MGRRHFFTLAVASAMLAALAGPAASAAITVDNQAELTNAVGLLNGTGGTIVLRPKHYAALTVGPRGPGRLHIVAQPGASAGRVSLCNTQAVTVRGLRLTPHGAHAGLTVCNSRNVTFEHLSVQGGTRFRSNVSVLSSSNVRIAESTFTRCGEGKPPYGGYCLRLRQTTGMTVVRSYFHDCYGCDFIHGYGNAELRVVGNKLERSLVGACGRSIKRCHHQDIIHLHEGRDLLFDGNRFGIYQTPGAAQIYLTGGIRRVTITNNVFRGTDSRLPGYGSPDALWIGNRRAADIPRYVVIKNNTILTGRPRLMRRDTTLTATSVGLSPLYSRLPLEERPILANNVIGLAATPRVLCDQVQAFVANVILAGKPCRGTEVTGAPKLDADARPTAASIRLLDRGDPRFATPFDIEGVARGRAPDIGAFEFSRS